MSHTNESCHLWMSHITYKWVMSHMNELYHIWMSHVTYESHDLYPEARIIQKVSTNKVCERVAVALQSCMYVYSICGCAWVIGWLSEWVWERKRERQRQRERDREREKDIMHKGCVRERAREIVCVCRYLMANCVTVRCSRVCTCK